MDCLFEKNIAETNASNYLMHVKSRVDSIGIVIYENEGFAFKKVFLEFYFVCCHLKLRLKNDLKTERQLAQ